MKLKLNVDLDSTILYDDPLLNNAAGGRFESPENIKEDITFSIRVKNKIPTIRVTGDKRFQPQKIKKAIGETFTGTRLETFQFGPNIGCNRNLIVFEVDKGTLFNNDSDQILSAWTESILKDGKSYIDASDQVMAVTGGPYIDSSGRALKNQATGLRMQISLHPSEHVEAGFGYSDMVILNTTRRPNSPMGDDFKTTSLAISVNSILRRPPNPNQTTEQASMAPMTPKPTSALFKQFWQMQSPRIYVTGSNSPTSERRLTSLTH